jgi:adenylate cyclase, class 2
LAITRLEMTNSHEIEIKLEVPSGEEARRLLRKAGFRVSRRKVFEANALFDTPKLSLRKAGALLRVRDAGGVATLTYKGPATIFKHKSREELELRIADPHIMSAIIGRLGLTPAFRYEKYRTEYRQSGRPGVAMVDETPIGAYLELEGPPRWIDLTARRLGFSAKDYITASYARLYWEWCKRHRMRASHMLFRPRRTQGS